jgi:FMN-dependent NADH-azoreductase
MSGTHLLHLDSSAGGAASASRLLGRELVLAWSRRDPSAVLTYRDLAAEPLAFVDVTWIAAAFTPFDQHDDTHSAALVRSEQLIAEVEAADVLVIGAPMYNLGIPAALKAWIDQVVRVGRTFGYDGPVPVGLLHGKRAIVLATSGGDARYYETVGMDFRTSYLRAILGFVGITDVDVVTVTGTMTGEPDLDTARAEIDALLDLYVGAGAGAGATAGDLVAAPA